MDVIPATGNWDLEADAINYEAGGSHLTVVVRHQDQGLVKCEDVQCALFSSIFTGGVRAHQHIWRCPGSTVFNRRVFAGSLHWHGQYGPGSNSEQSFKRKGHLGCLIAQGSNPTVMEFT